MILKNFLVNGVGIMVSNFTIFSLKLIVPILMKTHFTERQLFRGNDDFTAREIGIFLEAD